MNSGVMEAKAKIFWGSSVVRPAVSVSGLTDPLGVLGLFFGVSRKVLGFGNLDLGSLFRDAIWCQVGVGVRGTVVTEIQRRQLLEIVSFLAI